MEPRLAIISLLFLTVLVSGCADSGGKDEAGSITVTSVQIQPQEIYEGNSVTASVSVANTGTLGGRIGLGTNEDGEVTGRNILRNYCPDIFEPKRFSFQPNELANEEGVVNLSQGRELRMQWRLQHVGDPRLINEKCSIEFNLPFNYSVSSYKQIQIKQSDEVSGSPQLEWESSSGPMVFAIETIGSTSREGQSTFITPGTEEGTPEENVPGNMTVLLQLQNPSGEKHGAGVMDVHEKSLRIYATDPLELNEAYLKASGQQLIEKCGNDPTELGFLDCMTDQGTSTDSWSVYQEYSSGWMNAPKPRCDISADDEIRIYDGKSRVIRCEVPVPKTIDSPSKIAEIRASVDYTYLKDAGSRQVEVKPREQ